MASDMKKLDSLSKQIEQYESHLSMVKSDIASISEKRDKANAELLETQKKAKEVVAKAYAECEDFKKVMASMQADIDAQKQKIQEDRQKLNQDKSGLVTETDSLEMKRRDIENDKRRVAGFIQIITQAVQAWK